MPLPEQTRLELAAIDAALAGAPVDPEYAELAELALLLTDARPALEAPRGERLDQHFRALGKAAPARRPRQRPWFLRPAYGAALALVMILALLVIVLPRGGGGGSSSSSNLPATASPTAASGASAPGAGAASSSGAASLAATPTPRPSGRKIVQSAQLSLSAASARVGSVAQEVFNVVGVERGIVEHSHVSSGLGGHAGFTLQIPSARLSATLARLGRLRYARVTSSSASTSDVNSRYVDDQRTLADARALRASLLTQLAAATTTAQIDSLKAQIQDAETKISADESTLSRLRGQVSYSSVTVSVSASGVQPVVSGSHGFTLGRAAHDALDVLKVSAGVALIGLAVLVPLGLIVALIAWGSGRWRRRDRERALDRV